MKDCDFHSIPFSDLFSSSFSLFHLHHLIPNSKQRIHTRRYSRNELPLYKLKIHNMVVVIVNQILMQVFQIHHEWLFYF